MPCGIPYFFIDSRYTVNPCVAVRLAGESPLQYGSAGIPAVAVTVTPYGRRLNPLCATFPPVPRGGGAGYTVRCAVESTVRNGSAGTPAVAVTDFTVRCTVESTVRHGSAGIPAVAVTVTPCGVR